MREIGADGRWTKSSVGGLQPRFASSLWLGLGNKKNHVVRLENVF